MALKRFELISRSPIYYAGQIFHGLLLIELTKPKRVREIFINFCGKGRVQWYENKTTYRGEEKYLGLRKRLFGNGIGDRELAAGKYKFAFRLQLPDDLPSSYNDGIGRIEHYVQATIDRRWRFNHVKKWLITVMSIYDLNLKSIELASSPISKTKTFLGHSGPLTMTFDIPVNGFVSGQIIPIKILLDNKSGVRVKSIVATLFRKSSYSVRGNTKNLRASLSKKEVRLEHGFGWKKVFINFGIPALPPSNLKDFSGIMEFKYFLTVKATVGKFRWDLRISRQIEIGNIPYMPYQKPIIRRQPCGPDLVKSENYFPQLARYGDFAPPTFEKLEVPPTCLKRKPDLLYPVYEFFTEPAAAAKSKE